MFMDIVTHKFIYNSTYKIVVRIIILNHSIKEHDQSVCKIDFFCEHRIKKKEIYFIYEKNMRNYLLHASIVMLKQSATKKTAFTRAPSTSARAQPNVFFDHFFGDIYSRRGKQ